MTRTHIMTLYRGGDDRIEDERAYTATYEITPGTPERGNFGPVENYDPGSAPEAWLLTVECDGADIPVNELPTQEWSWLTAQIVAQHDFAAEASDRADYLYDRMRDERMERDL